MKNVQRHPLKMGVAVALAVLAACAPEAREDEELVIEEQPTSVETQPTDRTEARGMPVMTSTFERAEGTPEGQPVGGTVEVLEGTDPAGDYRLTVEIEGLMPGEHAWHIHAAPCGKEGPVVVPFTETPDTPGLARPLTPGASGVAEADVTIPRDKVTLDQLKSGEYSLHVHARSGTDHGPTVACANL